MKPGPARHLKTLEALKFEFNPVAAADKRTALRALRSARLPSADQVLRLHECLCFMQAWPDNGEVLAMVDAMLARFARRRDLRRHARRLADSGLAGTPIRFTFFAQTSVWIVRRWPRRLRIDWDAFDNAEMLERFIFLLASYSETPALDEAPLELRDWIKRLKGPDETDAAFVIRRIEKAVAGRFLHERLFEEFDIPLILDPGPETPSRTLARHDPSPAVFQTAPLDRSRPSIAGELRRPANPPRRVGRRETGRLIDLANAAMARRQRDLDAFAYASADDVSIVDDAGGLQFVLYGVQPWRRFLLEAHYGFLVLKNGVPVSYGAVTALFNSAEVAYTIFDSFRGGESARIYGRALAMVQSVFGCDAFMVDPYQLGEDNEDAIKSGAWWFYQKLGFRPRDRGLLRLMNQELSKIKRRPRRRTSTAVLRRLSSENVYLHVGRPRDDVLGVLNMANVGLKIVDLFARRFGSDRERGEQVLAREAARRLGVRSVSGWNANQRLAWRRWSPLVALIDGLERWPAADRSALARLIRAKGGRSELDCLRAFDAHRRLRAALLKLTEKG